MKADIKEIVKERVKDLKDRLDFWDKELAKLRLERNTKYMNSDTETTIYFHKGFAQALYTELEEWEKIIKLYKVEK